MVLLDKTGKRGIVQQSAGLEDGNDNTYLSKERFNMYSRRLYTMHSNFFSKKKTKTIQQTLLFLSVTCRKKNKVQEQNLLLSTRRSVLTTSRSTFWSGRPKCQSTLRDILIRESNWEEACEGPFGSRRPRGDTIVPGVYVVECVNTIRATSRQRKDPENTKNMFITKKVLDLTFLRISFHDGFH